MLRYRVYMLQPLPDRFRIGPAFSVQRQAHVAFCVFICASLLALSGFSVARGAPAAAFDTNRVTTLELTISEPHWNKLRYQHREAEFFPEEGKAPPDDPYTWFPAEAAIDGTNIGPVEIRKKGYIGSNDIRRPALKLRRSQQSENKTAAEPNNTNNRIPLDLTLNNNRQDPSLIRQFLAYEIFRRAGVPAPRCSFVSLQVNGKPLGIYTSVEPINETFLQEHFGRSDGNLYEGGRSDFRSNWVQNFAIKNNRKENDRSDLLRATTALEESKNSVLPALNTHFDAEAFFRFWAAESLVNQTDGYAANMNNFYLYHNPSTGRFAFIPWGADSTFSSGRPINSVRGDPRSVIGTGILANRLYNCEEGAAKYRATLKALLKSAWNEELLLREVKRLETLLVPSLGPQAAQFRGYVEKVRRFIKSRRAELSPELEGPLPTLKSRPLELAKRRNVGHFTGRFSTTLNADLSGGAANSAELSGTLWDQQLTFRDLALQIYVPPNGNADSDDRVMIVLSGSAQPGNKQYAVFLQVDPESYAIGNPIPIDHTHVIGWFHSQERMIGMLRGSLLLNKASKTPGGEIAGEFTIDIFSKLPKP